MLKLINTQDYELSKVQDNVAESVRTIEGLPWNGGVILEDVIFTSSVNTVIGTWTDFTPTGSFTTNTTYTGKYRRVGENIEVRNTLTFAGAPNAVSCTINLPTGFTIDTTKFSGSVAPAVGTYIGHGTALDTGVAGYPAWVYYSTTTVVGLSVAVTSGAHASDASLTRTVPFTIGNTDTINAYYSVPVTSYTAGVEADKTLDHGLRRTPKGFAVLKKSAAGDIYLSSTTNHRPDLQIILKSTQAMTATLWIF